ncbi:MCP four helix bundle domain-containing protein [Neisseriaceae bacterium JH1-16]|nr:MCP four helix bundle domain-containing protein [Neisseriaceae bacterium JH1-16]
MTLTKRLTITLSLALLAMAVVGAIGVWSLQQAQQRFDYVHRNVMPGLSTLNDIKDNFSLQRISLYQALLNTTSTASYQKELEALSRKNQALLDRYEGSFASDGSDRELLQADRSALNAYSASREQAISLLAARGQDFAKQVLPDLVIKGRAAYQAINAHCGLPGDQCAFCVQDPTGGKPRQGQQSRLPKRAVARCRHDRRGPGAGRSPGSAADQRYPRLAE